MTGDAFSKAKQALLASGLPLEMSLERLLSSSFGVSADFSYWRRWEGGHKDFSVDVRARGSIGTPWVTIAPDNSTPGVSIFCGWDILLECKYRRPNVKWVFAPLVSPVRGYVSARSRNTHLLVNGARGHIPLGTEAAYIDVTPADPSGTRSTSGFPVHVSRGVEFRPSRGNEENDEAFSASIRRGVAQLLFAHVPRLNDTLSGLGGRRGVEVAPMGWPEVHLEASTLMLVTTAEIWAFRSDVDLQAVENASSLEQIAEPVTAVEYSTESSRELRAHQTEWLQAIEHAWQAVPPDREQIRQELWNAVTTAIRLGSPSVLIVHHDNVETVIQQQRTAIGSEIRRMTQQLATDRGWTLR